MLLRRLAVAISCALSCFQVANNLQAATGTWSTTAISGNLIVPGNWSSGGPISTSAGSAVTDTLTFGTQTTGATTLVQDVSNFAQNIVFSPGASAYTWNTQDWDLSLGKTTSGTPNTTGSITNNSTATQIFNMGTGTLGVFGTIGGSGPMIFNGSIRPGHNVTGSGSNARTLTFNNSGSVYLNVDTNTLTGGTVLGGNGGANPWVGTTSSRSKMFLTGSGKVYAGNIGNAYVSAIELNGATSKLQLTGGTFAGSSSANGASQMYILGAGSGVELNDLTGSGISMYRTNYNLENRVDLAPHFRNIAGNNTVYTGLNNTATGAADWNTVGSVNGNWTFQSDAGKLTFKGGNMYPTSSGVTTTMQLTGGGNGQIDSYLTTYATATSNIVKSGVGTWTLTNIPAAGGLAAFGETVEGTAAAGKTSVFRGTIAVNSGTLELKSSTAGAPSINLISSSPITVAGGAKLRISSFDTSAAVNSAGNLTLGSGTGGSIDFRLVGHAGVAPLSVNAFTTAGSNVVNVSSSAPLALGQFPLINYAGGTIGGNGLAGLTLGSLPLRTQASLVNTGSSVDLLIDQYDTIRWNGTSSNTWDINTTQNWKTLAGGIDTQYMEVAAGTDSVTFNDNAIGNFNINVSTPVNPAGMTFENSTAHAYSFSGAAITTSVLNMSNSGNATFSGAAVTAAFLNVTNSGNSTFNGGNLTVSSAVNLNGSGITKIANTGALSLPAAIALNSGILEYSRTPDENFSNLLSGSGTFRKSGANTLTLTGNNTAFGGTVQVAGGVLKVGHVNALGSGPASVTSGGTLDVNGFNIANTVRIAGAGASGVTGALYNSSTSGITFNSVELTGNATIGSAVGGTGYNIGDGTISSLTTNDVNNNYTLTVDTPNEIDLFSAGDMGVKNIKIEYTGSGTANVLYIAGATTLGPDTGTLTLGNSGRIGFYGRNYNVAPAYQASGAVTKPIVVSNSANGGEIEVYDGDMTIDSPITLDGNLSVEVVNDINLNNTDFVTTLNGKISGNGNLGVHLNSNSNTGSRTGRVILTADNDYTGTTTIGGGLVFGGGLASRDRITLQVGNGGSTGSLGTGDVISKYILRYDRTGTFTIPNNIGGGGGDLIFVNPDGHATVSGTNTYSGITVVEGGSLTVTGSHTGGNYTSIADSAGTNAEWILNNATIDNFGRIYLAEGGTAVAHQTGGNIHTDNHLVMANRDTTGHATYNLHSGILSVDLNLGVGGVGTGVFNMEDGSVTVGRDLEVGYSGTGTFSQIDGEVAVGDELFIGMGIGNGTLDLSGTGVMNVTSTAYVGGEDLDVGGTGTLAISGNSALHVGLNSTTGGDLILGSPVFSTATVNLTGGLLDVANSSEDESTGGNIASGGPGSITFNFSGGTLKVRSWNTAGDSGGDLGNLVQNGAGSLLDVTGNSTTLQQFSSYDLGQGTATIAGGHTLSAVSVLNSSGAGVINVGSGPSTPEGDYNLNGTVDAADFVVWRKSINTPEAYDVWRQHFGETGGGSGFSGTLDVGAGTVDIDTLNLDNGNVIASTVTVGDGLGGALTGSGTIDGTLTLTDNSTLTSLITSSHTDLIDVNGLLNFDGDLFVNATFTPTANQVFKILDWTAKSVIGFDNVTFSGGVWDTGDLYNNGTVKYLSGVIPGAGAGLDAIGVPEPGTMMLLAVGLAGLVAARRRR